VVDKVQKVHKGELSPHSTRASSSSNVSNAKNGYDMNSARSKPKLDTSPISRAMIKTRLDSSPAKTDMNKPGLDTSRGGRVLNKPGQDSSPARRALNKTGLDSSPARRALNKTGLDSFPARRALNKTKLVSATVKKALNNTGLDSSTASSSLNKTGPDSSPISRASNKTRLDSSPPSPTKHVLEPTPQLTSPLLLSQVPAKENGHMADQLEDEEIPEVPTWEDDYNDSRLWRSENAPSVSEEEEGGRMGEEGRMEGLETPVNKRLQLPSDTPLCTPLPDYEVNTVLHYSSSDYVGFEMSTGTKRIEIWHSVYECTGTF
jgi:hypothetical protein